jgi:hypothetical protein
MAWLAWTCAFVSLWLAAGLLFVCREFRRDLASVWQALAEQRMHHNALERATAETFADVGATLSDLDDARCVPLWPAPQCQCNRCNAQRKLRVN